MFRNQLRSQLDRVPLHFVIKRRPLNAEKLRRSLFVTMTLGQRLQYGVTLHVVERFHMIDGGKTPDV